MTFKELNAIGGEAGAISGFLSWWGRELRALLPKSAPAWTRERRVLRIASGPEGEVATLTRPGWRQDKALRQVALGDFVVAAEEAGEEAEHAPTAGPVLRLSRSQVLSRRVTPPRAAEARLAAVLRHDMATQFPFGPEEAYFDYRLLGRKNGRLEVELFCIARTKLDRWRGALAAAGLAPIAVTVEEAEVEGAKGRKPRLAPIDLLRELKERRWAEGAPRRRVLAVAALALAAAVVWTPYAARQEQNARLQNEVSTLRREAREAIALEEEIARMAEHEAALVRLLQGDASRLSLLAAATRALPDGAWLRRLEVKERTIRLDGVAGEAAPLIGAVEASPTFENAAFLSPVIASPEGGERFEIGAGLTPRRSADEEERR